MEVISLFTYLLYRQHTHRLCELFTLRCRYYVLTVEAVCSVEAVCMCINYVHCWCECRDNSVVIESQPARRADQFKTFIRNIGLPAPPVIGRKISAPPTAPISSSVAPSSSGSAVGALPAIPSSPSHRSSDAVSSGSSFATPKHSVASLAQVWIYSTVHTHTPIRMFHVNQLRCWLISKSSFSHQCVRRRSYSWYM